MQKKAIVLGATGLVGSHLVNLLSNAVHIKSVVAITRRQVHYPSDKIQNQVVDFNRLTDFQEAFQGDYFFSCLGTTRKQAGSISAQRKVDLDYQLAAARLALDNGVSDYFLVSSSGANSSSISPYLKMKGELEDAVSELPFKQLSILQPSLLLGERSDARTAESLGSLVLPALCKLPGLQRYRPIEAWQVASKMVEISSQPSTGFQTLSLDQVFPSH